MNYHYLTGASAASVVASVDIANGAQTLLQTSLPHARNITMTVTDANSSISAGICTLIGTDVNGDAITEDLTVPTTGTATVLSTLEYKTITSATVSALAGEEAGDTITIGEGNNYQIETNAIRLEGITVGTTAAGAISVIDGTTGTTANVAELKASIAEGDYLEAGIDLQSGLRIIMAAASKITVATN